MEIPAGEEQTYNGTFSGVAEMLYFFIDTGWSSETTTHSGDVTITEIHFGGEQVETPVDPPVDPIDPPAGDEGLKLDFWVSDGSLYTAEGSNIKYNGAGNTYACVGSDITAHAAGNNTFTITITNNGASDSRVRVDLQAVNQVGNHKVVNTGAVGGDVWTDMEWGGSSVTVAAGASVTLVISYDETTERGAVNDIIIFVDSARGTADNYSADITISGMAFSAV